MEGREDSKRLGSTTYFTYTIILYHYFKKKSNCSNYKGITLLSVVLKVYKRIVEKKVREILDKQLEESQSDLRKSRSCQDHIFTEEITFLKYWLVK